MRLELSLVVSAAVACGGAAPSPAPKLAGQLGDVHSQAGERAGYRVIRACTVDPGVANHIGIVGTGSRRLFGGSDVMASLDELAAGWCSGLASCWGRGYGYSCTGKQMATHIYVADWRDVDRAIDRIGATLRDEGLGEEVLISVEPEQHIVPQSAARR
ncbi:MAG TPA: hypothetical protein VGG74_01745 [Kofleriaceae bacterium]|jgi:hypothetical protein